MVWFYRLQQSPPVAETFCRCCRRQAAYIGFLFSRRRQTVEILIYVLAVRIWWSVGLHSGRLRRAILEAIHFRLRIQSPTADRSRLVRPTGIGAFFHLTERLMQQIRCWGVRIPKRVLHRGPTIRPRSLAQRRPLPRRVATRFS